MKKDKILHILRNSVIGVIIAFTFWFVDTYCVNAAEFDYSVYYPTSTLGGLQFNNSSSYDAVNSNSEKTFRFNVSLESVGKSYEDSPYKVGDLVNFQITYCISPLAKVNAVYSSLKNYLDFNYQTDNQCAIGDGTNYWYGQVVQYAFVRLAIDSISYDDIEAEEPLTVWRYHFNTQSLNIVNSAPYGASMRFISMEYLNKSDYNSLIAEYSTKADIDVQINQNQQIIDSDISEEDKELPNDDSYKDYQNAEDDLKDKINQADLGALNIGIDTNSSSFIWNLLTNIIQTHTLIFGMFISILSIGVFKLAFGR